MIRECDMASQAFCVLYVLYHTTQLPTLSTTEISTFIGWGTSAMTQTLVAFQIKEVGANVQASGPHREVSRIPV